MKNAGVIAVVAVLAASGGVMASMWLIADRAETAVSGSPAKDEVEALRARVETLERQLDAIRTQDVLVNEAAGQEPVALTATPAQALVSAEATAAAVADSSPGTRRSSRAARREAEMRDKLIQAGWTQTEIDEVYRQRDIAALDIMAENHLARREMMEQNPAFQRFRGMESPLRQSMSETRYESYLEASGRPTTARVGNLLPGSPGDAAGLREGDRIIRYGDERVFDGGDLEGATYAGTYGEPVTVEIERDGSTFFLTLPRGPIGISSFRYRD
jgi:C-terminal processing protease CtpA/Prc